MVLPVLTDFGLRFVFAVLLLSSLGFLGLGIQPPNADWGALVRENMEGIYEAAPAVFIPAAGDRDADGRGEPDHRRVLRASRPELRA